MKNYVRLIVASDLVKSSSIEDLLGFPGDKTWDIGDIRQGTKLLEKENGWLINSRNEQNDPLSDHIASIKFLLNGHEHKFKKFSQDKSVNIQLSIAIYFLDEPPVFFEKNIIDWLSSIGASVDIDLYALSENDE